MVRLNRIAYSDVYRIKKCVSICSAAKNRINKITVFCVCVFHRRSIRTSISIKRCWMCFSPQDFSFYLFRHVCIYCSRYTCTTHRPHQSNERINRRSRERGMRGERTSKNNFMLNCWLDIFGIFEYFDLRRELDTKPSIGYHLYYTQLARLATTMKAETTTNRERNGWRQLGRVTVTTLYVRRWEKNDDDVVYPFVYTPQTC